MQARHEAQEYQRVQQQGHGRPIVSLRLDNGTRFVAVHNRLMHSKKWVTFHDFLGDYIKTAIGSEWGNAELKKPVEEQHPLLIWYRMLCELQRQFVKEPGKVASARISGAAAAYMHLAYNLYALDHEAELQEVLLNRLRHPDQFHGARYEVYVAASLVRAGFNLAFENEADGNTTHCEFTATYKKTGRRFSVEAKRDEGGRPGRQLFRALKKAANHKRMVFIDLNTPDHEGDAMPPRFLQHAFDVFRRYEVSDPQAQRLPPAYVLLTNTPWEHTLDTTDARCSILADGFHMPDFKMDKRFGSLREAIDARQAHIEIHDLLKSLKEHQTIPSTFDGENPSLAFGDVESGLTVGNRYRIHDETGAEIEGVLTSAVVVEEEGSALCSVQTDDDRTYIRKVPLTKAELEAWKRHPETFFGRLEKKFEVKDALGAYDFCMASYTQTPRDKLLKFLAGAADIKHFATLDQPALASIYCERLAMNMTAKAAPPAEPLIKTRWRKAVDGGSS